MPRTPQKLFINSALALAFVFSFAGCKEDKIRVYTAAKDVSPAVAGRPQWTKPATWTEQPGTEMRLASFLSAEKDGEKADISVSSLSGAAGGLLANVNRWRGQVGLEPVDENGLGEMAQAMEIPGARAALFDMAGPKPPEGKTKIQRTLVVVAVQEDKTWFFKMSGEDSVVAAERPNFVAFVQSVRFQQQ